MDKFIAKLVKDFEDKKVSRRQLIHTIQVAAATFAAGEQAANAAPADKGFKTINVNHISYSCPDYTIARDFYQHLMGMGVTQDNGQQCYMPFGPNEGAGPGTFLLPRGYPQPPATYTLSGAVSAPRAARGGTAEGDTAAGARGGRGAAGGAGSGAGGNGAARGDAQQAPQRPQVTIDHIAYTMKNWDKTRVKAILESWGLYPTEDQDSYHVRDPFGYDLQISGPGMYPWEPPRQPATNGQRGRGGHH
jgi:catechol 2,3-dioxygenase-like lactoylglutathione lyase family enzyme